MNADPQVMEFFVAPLTAAQSDALVDRIEEGLSERGYGLWAVEVKEEGRFIGFVGLNPVPNDVPCAPSMEIGWRLAASHWGKGLATEAAEAARDYAFGVAGLSDLVSFTSTTNLASQRVMVKIGMTRDTGDDFDHPRVPVGHPLRPHVLYRLTSPSASGLPRESAALRQLSSLSRGSLREEGVSRSRQDVW